MSTSACGSQAFATTFLTVLAVLVTACGNAAIPGTTPPTTAPTTTVAPATTGASGTTMPTAAYPTPSVESTDRPLAGDGGTTRRPASANVPAGPTLDGLYPNHPPFYFSETDVIRCEAFFNVSGGPVIVRDVDIVGQEPDGEPVFEIVRTPPSYVELDGGADLPCGEGSPVYVGDGRCTGVELPPTSRDDPVACAVAVRFTGAMDHTARLRFSLEALCTGSDRAPCDSAEVVALGPTPDHPVTARWTQSYKHPLHTRLARGAGASDTVPQPEPSRGR